VASTTGCDARHDTDSAERSAAGPSKAPRAAGRVIIDTVSTTHSVNKYAKIDTMSSRDTRRRIFEAAWNLIVVRGEAGFTMAHIAQKAKISRQALYLHFADRAELLDALVKHVDEERGLDEAVQLILTAPTGREAVHRMVSLQAKQNPAIWAVALAFEAVRRTDKAAQRSWQLRQSKRLNVCRTIVERLRGDGDLRPALTVDEATDLLYVITSLRMWEDLVLIRGWTADSYQERVTRLLTETLTAAGETLRTSTAARS
jgi:AcrR family transcriptional regulator